MVWPLSVVLVANTNGRLAIPALAGLLVKPIAVMVNSILSGKEFQACSRTRVTEATFTEFSSSATFEL